MELKSFVIAGLEVAGLSAAFLVHDRSPSFRSVSCLSRSWLEHNMAFATQLIDTADRYPCPRPVKVEMSKQAHNAKGTLKINREWTTATENATLFRDRVGWWDSA